jgi:putative addiction module killer protein
MKYTIETTDQFDKWLKTLKDKQAIKAILMRLMRAEQGNLGDIKPLGGNLSEMRIFIGKGYRLYFTIKDNRLIFIINAGNKSTQSHDIKFAKAKLNQME